VTRSEADAVVAAESLAASFAEDAVARDAANANPDAEVAAIRASGLLAIHIPIELGGLGLDWPAVLRVIRPILRADASIGHLLAYHYVNSWRVLLNENEAYGRQLLADTVTHEWFWGGAGNPRDEGLALVPDGDGYRVSGRKFFATGSSVADRITASGVVVATGEKLAIVLDGHAEGVTHHLDWNNLGQRLSASGSVSFDNVFVPAEQVLGPSDQDGDGYRPYASLSILFFQLVLAHLHVGLAEGALAEAIHYVRTATRPWATSGVETAVEDPYLLEIVGELIAQTRASDALVWRSTFLAAEAAGRGWKLSDDERGALAIEIAAAKVASTRMVLEVTSRAFELTGARATSTRVGFDRFWRNARTITLHDPVVYKARELGEHALQDRYPTPSRYS
jgi:alkylation response protein AidB-like acyl-CoA dehydrogenase